MNHVRKSFAALFIAGAVVGAGAGGAALIHAADSEPQHHVVTPQQIATANDLSTAFRNVGKLIEPSVVNISVRKTIKGVAAAPFDNDLLRRFFGDNPEFAPFGRNSPDEGNRQGQDQENGGSMEEVGTGSGVIMEVDGSVGYILTNNHVAGGATEMVVTLADGRRIDNAKLVGADPKSDLAVIRIQADHLAPANWGDSSALHQGDWVLAFGSPFGYVGSMTHGIVSALDRSNVGILGANGYEDFIQVDAPINPGNSGGPLVSLDGKVVGIDAAIASRSGAFSGIGFAIPSNEAKFVYTALRDHGKVVRGWLGASIADISKDPKVAASFGYKKSTGVIVESVLPKSPASGKLEAGDIIESLDGKPVESILQVRSAIAAMTPDSELKMVVWRKSAEVPVTVKLGTQPQEMRVAGNQDSARHEGASNALGMTLTDANDELARQFKLGENHQGALVAHVKPGSPADTAGLRPGDLITKIDNDAVKSAAEATDLLSKRDVKKGVRLYVTSPQGSRFVFIEVS